MIVSQERSFRIRSSRDLEELKPKLVTPWTGAEFEVSYISYIYMNY